MKNKLISLPHFDYESTAFKRYLSSLMLAVLKDGRKDVVERKNVLYCGFHCWPVAIEPRRRTGSAVHRKPEQDSCQSLTHESLWRQHDVRKRQRLFGVREPVSEYV